MKATFILPKKKVKDYINGRIRQDTKDNSKMISCLDKLRSSSSKISTIKAEFKMEKEKDLEYIDTLMEMSLRVNGKMMKN